MAVATRLRGKTVFIVIGAVLFGVLAVLLGPKRMPVDLGTANRGPLRIMVESEGRTRIKSIYTVSAPIDGRLLRISLKAGDTVKVGETVLALIKPPSPEFLDARTVAERRARVHSAEALCELARAEVKRAEAALDYARAELKRNETLIARRFLSPQNLEKSQMEVRTKEAEVAVAEKNLKSRESELDMNRASLLAVVPADEASAGGGIVKVIAQTAGKVLRVLQESEVFIKAGTPILEIGDPGDLEVLVEMLSENAAKVRVGAEASISGWGGKTLQGRVRRVEPYGFIKVSALGIEEQRVNVLIDFTDPAEDWRVMAHGYRIDAQVVVWARDSVLKAPMGALFRDGNDWAVFRVDTRGVAELRHVELGQSNDTEAEILGGLSEGDRVVLHPSDRLRTGMPIVENGG